MAEPFFQAGQLREDIDFEAKLAGGRDGKGKLPESFFETYSAFANTAGGVVLLGLKELEDGKWEARGILEPDKVIADLWAQLNSEEKVNRNLLSTDSVQKHELQKGRWLVEIVVPRATRKERPVYLKKNPLTGTYKRQGDGDFRCSEEEVRRMLAEQTEDARDARIIEHFGFDDLNLETFRAGPTELG